MADLLRLIGVVEEVVQAWIDEEGPEAPIEVWQGRYVHVLGYGIRLAVEQLATCLIDEDCEPDVWHTALAADDFVREFQVWLDDRDLPVPRLEPSGHTHFWHAYDAMREARAPRTFAKLEPIEDLIKQKVYDRQIAKMAGWFNERGEPDVQKVAEEKLEPGRHITKNWISPDDAERERQLSQAWRERAARVNVKRKAKAAAVQDVTEDCPETLEELVVLPGMTAKQCQRMKPSASPEQIQEAASSMGVRLRQVGAGPLGALPTKAARQMERDEKFEELQAERETAEAPQTLEASGVDEEALTARVAGMREQGISPGDISKIFEAEGLKITPQKISRMAPKAVSTDG